MDKILQHGKIAGLKCALILLKQHLDGNYYRIEWTEFKPARRARAWALRE